MSTYKVFDPFREGKYINLDSDTLGTVFISTIRSSSKKTSVNKDAFHLFFIKRSVTQKLHLKCVSVGVGGP